MCNKINEVREVWWTGTVRHYSDDSYDKLYLLKDSKGNLIRDKNWIKVCATSGELYKGSGYSWLDSYWKKNTVTIGRQTCYKLWVAQNCVVPGASTCSATQCPG